MGYWGKLALAFSFLHNSPIRRLNQLLDDHA